jgi:putative transposase
MGSVAPVRERGTPFGNAFWVERTAAQLHLESTLRPRGRPRNNEATGTKLDK